MARKKLIKAFDEEKYSVFEWEGLYLIYDKTKKGKKTSNLYIGAFALTSDNKLYVFQGNEYADIQSLLKAMEEYNNSLPFNHELYCPVYKKSYFITECIYEYLNRIGLTQLKGCSDIYTIYDFYGNEMFTLSVHVNDGEEVGKVVMWGRNKDEWYEVEFHDLDSAISAVNSILAPYSLLLCSTIVKVVFNMSAIRTSEEINNVSIDLAKLEVITKGIREQLIGQLEKELESLKGCPL